MPQRFLACILAALLLLPAPAHADNTPYLTPKDLPARSLPAPPKRGSAAWRFDLQQIIALQTYATDDQMPAIRDEIQLRPELMTSVLPAGFDRAQLPLTFALLDRTGADMKQVVSAAKKFWHVPRPFKASKKVRLLIDPPGEEAYPSGHTAVSLVWAKILQELQPQYAAKLTGRAGSIAWHRMYAGVHTPHDIEAGRLMGEKAFALLQKNPRFQSDLEAARREIADADLRECAAERGILPHLIGVSSFPDYPAARN